MFDPLLRWNIITETINPRLRRHHPHLVLILLQRNVMRQGRLLCRRDHTCHIDCFLKHIGKLPSSGIHGYILNMTVDCTCNAFEVLVDGKLFCVQATFSLLVWLREKHTPLAESAACIWEIGSVSCMPASLLQLCLNDSINFRDRTSSSSFFHKRARSV